MRPMKIKRLRVAVGLTEASALRSYSATHKLLPPAVPPPTVDTASVLRGATAQMARAWALLGVRARVYAVRVAALESRHLQVQ